MEELIAKYPNLFSARGIGFGCGPGWYGLLEDMLKQASALPDPPHIVQIKEKFGGLRVYTDRVHQQMDQLIRVAEARAARTCEGCCTTDLVTQEGAWIKTLCPACREKRDTGRRRSI